MSTTQQIVADIARAYGYSNRTREIDAVAQFIDAGTDERGVVDLVTHAGANRGLAQEVAAAIFRRLGSEPTTGPVNAVGSEPVAESTEPAFDRQRAADVVRAFILNSGPHLAEMGGGFAPEYVDALLVLAGLEDEPEPEAEVEDEPTPSVLRRLLSWARGQGFNG